MTNLSYQIKYCRLNYFFLGVGFCGGRSEQENHQPMCQAEGKTRVGGLVAFHIQRHPPIPPRETARDGQVHLEAAAQVQGVGAGRAAECPRTKEPPGARAEVTCCLQGRLKRTGEGIRGKWCCSSLGNQFVPPLIGHFALPPWESLAMCFQVSPNQVRNEVAPLPARAPSNSLCPPHPQESLLPSARSHFPFLPPWGSPAPLYPGSFHKEAESGTFPHSLTLRFLFSQ